MSTPCFVMSQTITIKIKSRQIWVSRWGISEEFLVNPPLNKAIHTFYETKNLTIIIGSNAFLLHFHKFYNCFVPLLEKIKK